MATRLRLIGGGKVQSIYPTDDWLDTETRAILCKSPPPVETAIDAEGYSLILVKAGRDENRVIQAVSEIQRFGAKNLTRIPTVIAQQLTLDDVMAGQFALSCCDSVSVFVRDTVVCDASDDYLHELSATVMDSAEFELISVRVIFIPMTDLGRRFSWQFLGVAVGIATPSNFRVHRKKARLMMHWATKCDVHLEVVTD